MSLTRKQLSAMGIEADKIEQIIEMHTETISGLKDKVDEQAKEIKRLKPFEESAAKLEETAKESEALRKEVERLKPFEEDAKRLPEVQGELDKISQESKDGTENYERLKKEYEDFKARVDAERTRAAKQAAYTEILKDAGITSKKAIDKVLKYTDFDGIELGEDGKVKDGKDRLAAVREEWPELISRSSSQGADVANPPGSQPGGAFETMSLAEKMQFANEHPGDPQVRAWLDPGRPAKASAAQTATTGGRAAGAE